MTATLCGVLAGYAYDRVFYSLFDEAIEDIMIILYI